MPSKIYVGNMSYSTTEDELRQVFSQHGEVSAVNIVKDRESADRRKSGS